MSNLGAVTSFPGGGRGNERFRAVAATMVPEAASLGEPEWREAEAIVARVLAARPAGVRRQIGLFLRVLDFASLLGYRRRLAALSPDERTQFLESLSKSRLLLVRRGIWGLRTLAFMGYYARGKAAQEIGYRASPSGWAARQSAPRAS